MDRKSNKMVIVLSILIIVLLIVVLGGLTYYIMNNKETNKIEQIIENGIGQLGKNQIEEEKTEVSLVKSFYSQTKRVQVDLYSDGTAIVKIKEGIEQWTDYADINSKDAEEQKEAQKRTAGLSNMVKDRRIPLENKNIIDIYMSKHKSYWHETAYAIIKCSDNTYYYVDLIGYTENEAQSPLILKEFTEIKGQNIVNFDFRTDTVEIDPNHMSIGNDYIYAITESSKEIQIYNSETF